MTTKEEIFMGADAARALVTATVIDDSPLDVATAVAAITEMPLHQLSGAVTTLSQIAATALIVAARGDRDVVFRMLQQHALLFERARQ